MVENIRLVLIKIWNSGALAIKREDYEEPIAFETDGIKCLDIQFGSEPQDIFKPEDSNNFLKLEPNYLKLSPVLLNPADTINLKLLVSGQGKIRGTARIIDGKLIEFDPGRQQKTSRSIQSIGSIILIAVFFAFLILPLVAPNLVFNTVNISSTHELTLSPLGSIFFGLLLILIFLAVLTYMVLQVMEIIAKYIQAMFCEMR